MALVYQYYMTAYPLVPSNLLPLGKYPMETTNMSTIWCVSQAGQFAKPTLLSWHFSVISKSINRKVKEAHAVQLFQGEYHEISQMRSKH